MTDIKNIKDIELLVNTFYEGVRANKTIGYIFNGKWIGNITCRECTVFGRRFCSVKKTSKAIR